MPLADRLIQRAITDKAIELGFVKLGFARAEVLEEESVNLKIWTEAGCDADMKWLERSFEKRKDIKLVLPDAKSIISLAYNYYTPLKHDEKLPKISRYAWGKDYHKVLKRKLKELSEFIEARAKDLRLHDCRLLYYADDGPVMDKVWAVRAGVGWMGKHTNVISPEYGSWIFLCEIITNLEFEVYDEPIEDLCGSCRICIEACPTGAIVNEYVLDSNRCISYQTIENRGSIPGYIELHGWIFGCDVCQDVCPFNRNDKVTSDTDFFPKREIFSKELPLLNEESFANIFRDSPVKRTKFSGWKRNLKRFESSKAGKFEG
jgi:epoxyqueuosine reductase